MNYLFVEGPANIGKSTFLRALCSRFLILNLYEIVDCEEIDNLENFRYLLRKCNIQDEVDEYIIINSPTDDDYCINNRMGAFVNKHSHLNIKTIITSIRSRDTRKNIKLHDLTLKVLGVSNTDSCETISLSGLRKFCLI